MEVCKDATEAEKQDGWNEIYSWVSSAYRWWLTDVDDRIELSGVV